MACRAQGKLHADLEVATSLHKRAMGYKYDAVKPVQFQGEQVDLTYEHHVEPDTSAAQFWLINRRPEDWQPVTKVEVSGPGGGPMQLEMEQLSAADIIRRRLAGLSAAGDTESDSGGTES